MAKRKYIISETLMQEIHPLMTTCDAVNSKSEMNQSEPGGSGSQTPGYDAPARRLYI